jgi:Flp pilus assembly protein TadD/peroxiredoxin
VDRSRRWFLKTTGVAGAFLASRLRGLPSLALAQGRYSPCLLHVGSGYAPSIEPFLKQIRPGSDEFIAEKYAAELDVPLRTWQQAFCASARDLRVVHDLLSENLDGSLLNQAKVTPVRSQPPVQSDKVLFPRPEQVGRSVFVEGLNKYLAPFKKIETAELQIDLIEIVHEAAGALKTQIHYDLVGALDTNRREERTGEWELSWLKDANGRWCVTGWSAGAELRSRLTGRGFTDISIGAFGSIDSYRSQMCHGVDHWRAVLDGASGIDIYGNNGICAGDFDGDGYDDLYVCQPAGLPNRLYRNRGDGTFIDVTEKAGVGLLDGTSSALFADLTNNGRQDLIVVRTSGPLLFINRGDGTFELKPDAFHFARPTQGTFTGVAIADYDRDGLLDVYFCTYSFYQGLSEYEYPKPYYDAQNGPPNFLLKNRGEHTFEDVTVPSGLDVSNNRFSFCCGWDDYNRDGWPDLYVVNDFGRKVLYRNNGNGTFTDVSAEAGVEDPGEGMSMIWFDYDNDGGDDMYVVNMWEAAGRRVTKQPEFMPTAPENIRRVYWEDAAGNTLLHNERASGKFHDVTEGSGIPVGGWNWGSDAWDFDHDRYPDLYVANGFISGAKKEDLSSFYWRQVAARSLDSGGQSKAYADAWSAINEFIRSDYTWSGYQRNNFYLNNRDATFTEAAGLLGLDCVEDGRSFALSDIDGDGRLEIILKNRTAPQLRVFHNELSPIGGAIMFSLRGNKSNRDAIGAIVEVVTTAGRQQKTLRAGSGFLSQNTKMLHFGLGEVAGPIRAIIEWPNGEKQVLDNVPSGHQIEVQEGSAAFRATPFRAFREIGDPDEKQTSEEPRMTDATWLLEPITPPGFSLPDQNNVKRSLSDGKGSTQLLVFWTPGCDQSRKFLVELNRLNAEWKHDGLTVLSVRITSKEPAEGKVTGLPQLSLPVLTPEEKTAAVYNIFYRYLFDRRREIESPTSFLIDGEGKVVRVYPGYADPSQISHDARTLPVTAEDRLRRGLPFPGRYFSGQLHHNYFTYGVAYLQYEYFDEALAAFEQSIDHGAPNGAAYYNIGLIYLNKGMFGDARTNLEQAVKLDPNNADAWNNLGVVYGQQGDYNGAQSDFQKALDLQPTHLLAIQNMVKLYRYQGREEAAQSLLEKAIALDPSQAELHQGLAMLFVEEKDLPRAKLELEKATQLEPRNVEMLNGLGVVLMEMGESAKAMESFENCRRLAPDYDRPYLNMAVLYLSAGKGDKAHDLLSEFLARQPDNEEIRQALREVDSKK